MIDASSLAHIPLHHHNKYICNSKVASSAVMKLFILYYFFINLYITSLTLAYIRLLSLIRSCRCRPLLCKNGETEIELCRLRLLVVYTSRWPICGDSVYGYLFTRPRVHVFHQYRWPWPLRPPSKRWRHAQQIVRCSFYLLATSSSNLEQRNGYACFILEYSLANPSGLSCRLQRPRQQPAAPS